MSVYNLTIEGKLFQVGDDHGFIVYGDVHLDHDTFYIVCPYGIGDTLYVASLAESFKKSRSIAKLCLIVKQGHRQIPDWFDAIDEKIVSDEIVNTLNLFSIFIGNYEYNNYLYGHFRKDKNGAILPEYGACEIKNMIYRYKKLVFHLPPECLLEEPKITPDELLFERLMSEYHFNQNCIILMPYANSTALISAQFWAVLASFFINLGFTVFTNVKDAEESPVLNTIGLCADLATMAAICECCRLVISLRSGICDILAFTETNLVVLNTSEYHFNEWNLKSVTDRKNIYSFLTSNKDLLTSLLRILNEK
jgi:ADP-heptose:LPS heptosyltransferase